MVTAINTTSKSKSYSHWTDVPKSEWHWPNFSPEEMACRGSGKLIVDERAMDMLQTLRNKLGKPLIVQSAYRTPAHNKKVGGAKKSQHLLCKAFDISMLNHNPVAFEEAARSVGFKGIGHYPMTDQNFMHVDARATGAKWNKGGWFPIQAEISSQHAPSFKTEPKADTLVTTILKPEVLAPVGTILGGGAAIAQGTGPVQWALGIGVVGLLCFGIFFAVRKSLQAKPGD